MRTLAMTLQTLLSRLALATQARLSLTDTVYSPISSAVDTPFTAAFNVLVDDVLEKYHIPGLSISVVSSTIIHGKVITAICRGTL